MMFRPMQCRPTTAAPNLSYYSRRYRDGASDGQYDSDEYLDSGDEYPLDPDFMSSVNQRPKAAYRFRTPVNGRTVMECLTDRSTKNGHRFDGSRPNTASVFYQVMPIDQPHLYRAAADDARKQGEMENPYRSITDDLNKLQGIQTPTYSAPHFNSKDRAQRFSRLSVPNYQPVKEPIYRSGRGGAPWRHVQACYNNGGNHLCFINGSIKLDDTMQYPPFGYPEITSQLKKYGGPLYPTESGRRSLPLVKSPYMNEEIPSETKTKPFQTSFNERAQKNFKYWHEDKKFQKLPAKQTIQGKMFAKGIPMGRGQ